MGGFLNPYNFKTDFRSWPHRQLHKHKEWYPKRGWGQEGERRQEPLKPDQGRPVPWWDRSLAVCLCCSYCHLVKCDSSGVGIPFLQAGE